MHIVDLHKEVTEACETHCATRNIHIQLHKYTNTRYVLPCQCAPTIKLSLCKTPNFLGHGPSYAMTGSHC